MLKNRILCFLLTFVSLSGVSWSLADEFIGSQTPGTTISVTDAATTVKIGSVIDNVTLNLDGGNLRLTGVPIQENFWNQHSIRQNLNGYWNDTNVVAGARANGSLDTIFANNAGNYGNLLFGNNGLTDTYLNYSSYPTDTTLVWTGFFTAGLDNYDIWCMADDSFSFWIDKYQDGYFQAGDRVLAIEYGNGRQRTENFQLTPGETYAVTMIFAAAGGGNDLFAQMGASGTLGADKYMSAANGAENGGQWYASLDSDFSGTTINVNQNASVDFLMQKNTLGAMNLNDSRVAMKLGNMGVVDVNQLSVSGDSGIDVSAGGTANLKNISFAGNATLTKFGDGTMGIGDQTPGTKFSVAEGTLRAADFVELNGVSFTLDGGKLSLGATEMTDKGKLRLYRGGTIAHATISGTLTYGVGALADGTRSTLFPATFSGAGDLTNVSLYTEGTEGGDWAKLWTGFFIPDFAQLDFWQNVDDAAAVWIDLNHDGVYQANERIWGRDWGGSGPIPLPDLVPGEVYGIAIVGVTSGGNNRLNMYLAPRGTELSNASTDYAVLAEPNLNGVTWGARLVSDYSGTNINVTADSELELRSQHVALGNIALDNNSTLEFTGMPQDVEIRGLSGAGTLKAGESVTLVMGADTKWTVNIRGENDYDQIFIDGASLAMLDGLTLEINLAEGFELTPDMLFELMVFGDVGAQLGLSGMMRDGDYLKGVDFAGALLDFSGAFLQIGQNGSLLLGGLEPAEDANTPEPAAWMLLLTGALGLAIWRKHRV